MTPPRRVALLRGINVGGNKRIPMAELRTLAADLGWDDVATYIQSGNVVFRATGPVATLETDLENAIEQHFGFTAVVIVRPAQTWLRLAAGSPFANAEKQRPNLLHLGLAKKRLKKDIATQLKAYCNDNEQVVVQNQALWIDAGGGVSKSRMTPAVLDRLAGSTVTMRNWKTVQAIARLLAD